MEIQPEDRALVINLFPYRKKNNVQIYNPHGLPIRKRDLQEIAKRLRGALNSTPRKKG